MDKTDEKLAQVETDRLRSLDGNVDGVVVRHSLWELVETIQDRGTLGEQPQVRSEPAVHGTGDKRGEFDEALHQDGYVEITADPRDRRAKLVRPTPRGRRLQKSSADAIEELERDWRERAGARRWATFRSVLAELGRDL